MYRKRSNTGLAVIVTFALAVTLAGCPTKGPYHDAVTAEHDFTTVLSNFQKAEMAEHTNGRIDAAEHQKLEAGVEKVGNVAQVLVAGLQANAGTVTIQGEFTAIENALNSLVVDGVFSVKNAQSQNLLAILVKSIQDILQNIGLSLSVQTTTPITAVPATKGAN
jgi:hypothetical protein